MCKHMVEKFCEKDAKKGSLSEQMEFRKRSITSLSFILSKKEGINKARNDKEHHKGHDVVECRDDRTRS